MRVITHYYKKLSAYTKDNRSIGSVNEWIVDNYYLISEQETSILNALSDQNMKELKRLSICNAVVKKFLESENYKIGDSNLFDYLNKYQVKESFYFTYQEIDYINIALKTQLIERLRELTERLEYKLTSREKIRRWFRKAQRNRGKEWAPNIEQLLKTVKPDQYFQLVEWSNSLKSFGEKAERSFVMLNEMLETKNLSLRDLIKYEQDENTKEYVLMVNLFTSMKAMNQFKIENLYANISFTEKALMSESANIYDNMYEISKMEYRREIRRNVRRGKLNEYDYVKQLLEEANEEEKHIGFYLFKEPNISLRSNIYIVSILVASIVLSVVMSSYFGAWSFLFLIIPMIGFLIDLSNQIFLKTIRPKSLFRLKMEGNLKEEHSTMVVIPTIVKDPKKVIEMFENLETYYLSNPSPHIYYTLLGDASSEKTKKIPMDQKVIETGLKKVAELNAKYGEKVFYFVYRNRFYNESEGCYLGLERKRGALEQFNQLLLGKLSADEKTSFFQCQTFESFNKRIKYVITLDSDTRLLLNTALKLIGTMAHPMNRPVLSEDGRKVVKGYGILQPRVSVEVEVTNKSDYAQLFAGLGGFDIYSTKHFDLYQDIFDEGIFTGKGIYDLEVFDRVLSNTFPNNLILSHDLLESTYIRCGYISDVELFDGFPSRYLNDAMRHHRWTRGDWQIIGWIKEKVRNKKNEKVENPISLISKWKIMDNIRRSLMVPSLLIFLIYAYIFPNVNAYFAFLFVLMIITVPIFFYIMNQLLYPQRYDPLLKYYLRLVWGIVAMVIKAFIMVALLPYETYLYLDAIIRALYRMLISKKNLLNWITAEEVEKTSKNTLQNYLKNFIANDIMAIIIIALAYSFNSPYITLAYFMAIIWVVAPFFMWFISRDICVECIPVKKEIESDVLRIAKKTWKFFETYLTEEYNYLIPDNYQSNRKEKIDVRTSPTNIGFSITSVISAVELKLIKREAALELLTHIIESVEKLEKWHGHLYNWYDITTMKQLPPLFISTADSGNFISSLYVLKGFLQNRKEGRELLNRVLVLIKEADFSRLYNKEIEVFSIGFSVSDALLVPFHYNKFLSEARLASYIAIAKGEVPFRHWFSLDKTLTKYKWYKGVVSWTGTLFEYLMPLIFMRSYEHSLLDETYAFACYAHKSFMQEANPKLPWGITESAYNELDDSQNYKYKAFGIPYLKFHDSETPDIVVAPYGSIMALPRYPDAVYENMKKFEKLGMEGDYGFYESYDAEDKAIVKAYYSHHQGMILASITNYLKNNIIQSYFHNDKHVQSIEILLKEKVQIRTYIDLKIAKYKKHNYKRDVIEGDVREQDGIYEIPNVGVLSNGYYSVVLNDRGIGFSKYKNLQVNRYRKITDEDYGMFLYIKNIDNGKLWSNTYSPTKTVPDKYHVSFATDRIKYMREDDGIIVHTEITVAKEHNAEIRKITIHNDNNHPIHLELTTYGEVILARNEEDVAHALFNSITIDAEKDDKRKAIIFSRLSRTKENTNYYGIHRFFTDNDQDPFVFETSRTTFLGRNHSTMNPNMEMTSNVKNLLQPIMSIQKKVTLKENDIKTFYLVVGFGKSKEQVLEVVDHYKDKKSVEEAFEEATVLNNNRNHYAGLSGEQLRAYNSMLRFLYFPEVYDENRIQLLSKNTLAQHDLWKYGVSGDLSIIYLEVKDGSNLDFIREVLQAYEFYKSRALYFDFVIYNNESSNRHEVVDKYIETLMYRIRNLNYFENSAGNVYVLKDLSLEEEILFQTVAKVTLVAEEMSFMQAIANKLKMKPLILRKYQNKWIPKKQTKEPDFGHFENKGKEYVVSTTDTPMPWSNIIANKNFGTVITNNFGGYTYAYNSREFKITSWSNDPIRDNSSETFFINGRKLLPTLTKHGFGYSKFLCKEPGYEVEITVFVPEDDNAKIYLFDLINHDQDTRDFDISFQVKPVLGVSEEYSSDHILSRFDKKQNALILQNVYNKLFRNEKVFIHSNQKITNVQNDMVGYKTITTSIHVSKRSKLSFMIGCANNIEEMIQKYEDIKQVEKAFKEIVKHWKNKLDTIVIETPSNSFNTMMNGWYLYQIYASRLYAKTAFYQVGGATGFRDQLQDVLAVLYTEPEYARNQILKHASHQFMEGDVLHWWHDELSFGSRTRFSDDYLWLIYVAYEYLKVTNDDSILDEKVSFIEAEQLYEQEKEKGMNFVHSITSESLFYHMKLAITKAIGQIGKHGLPLMGGGDWNDGMNKVGEKGKGESVWLAFFLYDLLHKMADLSDRDIPLRELCLKKAEEIKNAIKEHAWDGKWYLRAYFDDGTPLGSVTSKEGKIDLNPQAWSILTGIAEQEKIDAMIPSVEQHLVDKKIGIIKLIDPPFTKQGNNPGYISDYLPGIRENGSQYTHAAMWYIMALIKIGQYEKATEYFEMINPMNRDSNIYKVEPYVIAADIYSNPNFKGQGGWTWYTGSASWAYKIGLEEIVGLKRRGNTLEIEPHFIWDSIMVTYQYKDTTYEIKIYKNAKKETILLENDKKKHNVVVGGSNDSI